MDCAKCKINLLPAEDLCFYVMGTKSVHLIVKPERLEFVDNKFNIEDSSAKKKDLTCKNCQFGLGKKVPIGPSDYSPLTFGNIKVFLFGKQLHKKVQWYEVYKFDLYDKISLRDENNFFQALETVSPSKRQRISTVAPGKILFPDPQDPSTFAYKDNLKSDKTPRDYQLIAYIEALQKDLIVVLPTGYGKTLIASLVAAKMIELNQENPNMVLFIVDRIPLVFQQGEAISVDTQLEVCALTSENNTRRKKEELINGEYQVLVATAGAYVAMEEQLGMERFCCVILDECHHATKGHIYIQILESVKACGDNRPRVLGLTASPPSAKGNTQGTIEMLSKFKSLFFNAAIYNLGESEKGHDAKLYINIIPKGEDHSLLEYQDKLKNELERLANVVNEELESPLIKPEYWNNLRKRASLGQVFSHLSCNTNDTIVKSISLMKNILQVLETTEQLGVTYANTSLEKMDFYKNLNTETIYSARVLYLLAIVKDLSDDSKILIFVQTRKIAQILTTILKEIPEIEKKFSPLKIIGQYGQLGMSWEREQHEIIKKFSEGNCNILVSTSVLEEGQDIPDCDVVIRFDGIQSLISYTQSKGRARKDSQFILILSEDEHKMVKEIQKQEEIVANVLQTYHSHEHIPSDITMGIKGKIKPEESNKEIKNENLIKQSQCVVEFYLTGRHELLDIRDSIAEFLKEKYYFSLSHIYLAKTEVEWKARGIFPHEDTLVVLGLETMIKNIYERYRYLSSKWNFSLEQFSDNIWTRTTIHPGEENKESIMSGRWDVDEILWGSFKDRNTFLTGNLKEFGNATFELDEFYLIIRSDEIAIEIALVSIHRFILADWNDKNVRLYIPLKHPPEIRMVKEGSFRLTALKCDALKHFGDYPVFGVSIRDDVSNWSKLWILLHSSNIFPVPLFESRIQDDTLEPMECDENMKNNPYYWEEMMQKCVWDFSILKANTNVCLPPELILTISRELTDAGINDLPYIKEGLEELLKEVSKMGTHYFFDLVEAFKNKLVESKKHPINIIPEKENYCYIECAILTPSRLIPLHPIQTQCNRLFRKYSNERFLNLAFRDENEGDLNTEVLERVDDALNNGIDICGVKFFFLVCSSSQLRSKRAIFIQIRDLDRDQINQKIKDMRFELIGKSEIINETRFLSRIGLFCTSDKPTCEINEAETECLADIEADNKLLLTDGAGKIKKSLARKVLEEFGPKDTVETASALQIRLAGLKGVFTIVDDVTDPDFNNNLQDRNIIYRESMRKIAWTHSTLCIVKVAKHNRLFLNIQMLNLLTSLEDSADKWDPKPRIRELHKQQMDNFAKIFIDSKEAQNQLGSNLPKNFGGIFHLLNILSEPYFLKLLRCIYTHNIKNLIEKVHIPIPLNVGCILMGIPDPIGVLDEGEVFITYQDKEGEHVKDGRILIYKNPCLHPGDLLTPTAVDKPELRTLHNVIVFPIRGTTSLSACCGGGDLDGDEYAIIWDESLIPPETATYPAQNYDEIVTDAKKELEEEENQGNIEAKKPVQNDPNIVERLTDGYRRIISNDLLGIIAHYHLSICDQKPDGARDPLSIELSAKASLAVDSPKTGIIPEIPKAARELITAKGYPDFMEKNHKSSFISDKLLGELYHSAREVCYSTSEWVNVLKFYDEHDFEKRVPGNLHISTFEIPGYTDYMEDAELRYYEYSSAFRQIMLAFGIETEAEVVTSLIIKCHPLLMADKGKTKSALKASFDHLTEEFRERFHRGIPKSELKKKGAAWYITVYRMSTEDALCSFAWIVPEYLAEILCEEKIRFNSESQVYRAIGESAKVYLLQKSESIRTYVDSKLSVLPLIEAAVNGQPSEEGASEESPHKMFDVVAFGSSSVYLCELDSDLDISISPTEYGRDKFDISALDIKRQRKHILSIYVSPKISEIADIQSDKLEVDVPIISFAMLPGKDEPSVNVDITVQSDGVLKNGYIRRLYGETQGIFFAWMWLLVHWARHVGILKCHNSPDSTGIILTAEFEALVLHIYERMTNIANKVAVEDANPSLKSLFDSLVNQDIDHILGAMLEEFFHLGYEITSKAEEDIIYTWPVEGEPFHTIHVPALKHISSLMFQGWHCLVFTRDISKLFERAKKQFHVTHRFSHRMSGKIKMETEFYRNTLANASGAKIEFQIMGRNMLLTGYGASKALFILTAEMSALEAETALSKRYKSNANHYMMEGCVTMTIANSSQDCKIKLNSLKGCYKHSHFNNERDVVVPEGKATNEDWKIQGTAKIKSLLCNQLKEFPTKDTKLLEKLQLKTRFGFFYVLDGRCTFNNTGALPLGDFLKSLVHDIKQKEVKGEIEDINVKPKDSKEVPPCPEKKNSKKSSSKNENRSALSSAFCPGIRKTATLDEAKHAFEIYVKSLLACGFQPIEKEKSWTWRVDMHVSGMREVRFDIDEKLDIIAISERPIIWLLATIVGDRRTNEKAHDLRIRAESAKSLEKDSTLCKSILTDGHASDLFTFREEDNSPIPSEIHKQRMRFIKQNLETSYYELDQSLAKVSYGIEFCREDWKCPRYSCELSMYHGSTELGRIVAAGNSSIEVQALADRAVQVSFMVSEAITAALSAE